jgi:hypothetical protein
MKLYEITEFVMDFEDSKDVLEPEEIEYINNQISKMVQEKSVGIIKYSKNIEYQISAIDDEIKRLQAMKKAKQKSMESFKEYLKNNMKAMGIEKIDTGLGKISFRKSTSTNVVEEKLPNECFDIVYKRKTIDDIKEILKDKPDLLKECLIEVKNENLQIK